MRANPPGPKGEPLFGSSRQYARDPFRFLAGCEAAYGDVVNFDLGPMDTYLLTDPAAIERVLVTEPERFAKPAFQDNSLGELLGKGLLLSEGQQWEKQRELANPAFAMGRLVDFADDIVAHNDDQLAGWSDGDIVDMEQEMTEVTLSVIVDLMLGTDLTDERVQTIREALEPLGARFEPDPVRFAAPPWLPMPGDGKYDEAVATMEGVIEDIVAERRGTVGDPERDEGPDDLLSILLRAQARGEQTDTELRDEVMTILLAGHDTTALTLTYTWYLLSEHPEVEKRVHEEIEAVVGDDEPTMADVRAFDVIENVVNEALRLYPPVYTMFREATEDTDFNGYQVPEGSAIMLSQWAMHRSERYWENPERFNPERWNRDTERPSFAYFPFGGGPRHCIGKHLALLEAQLIVARTAQRYTAEYTRDDVEWWPTLTMHPRNGMPMRIRER